MATRVFSQLLFPLGNNSQLNLTQPIPPLEKKKIILIL